MLWEPSIAKNKEFTLKSGGKWRAKDPSPEGFTPFVEYDQQQLHNILSVDLKVIICRVDSA